MNIFTRRSPLHDGAVIIADGRIKAASCYLPLTTDPNLSRTYGTRHRAAIGITEESDALAIVVSEERGVVSLARDGKIIGPLDAQGLRRTLQRRTAADAAKSRSGTDAGTEASSRRGPAMLDRLLTNWPLKLLAAGARLRDLGLGHRRETGSSRTSRVPLEISLSDEPRCWPRRPPNTVTVRLRGAESLMRRLDPVPLSVQRRPERGALPASTRCCSPKIRPRSTSRAGWRWSSSTRTG